MKETCLVSIITACYNGEKFIDQYMESVLWQTYSNIELILVNDGSTDSSEAKILKYKSKLREKGIQFEYIYKENGGHPSAINAGLKCFHGKYLTWPDIDDVMHPDYIETKMRYMEKHPEVDYLITPSAVVDINNPAEVIRYTWKFPPKSKNDMMYRIISGVNYNYEPGSFFISAQIWKKANPKNQIYDDSGKWTGPQIQMMMPVIYYGNYGYLDKCLFDYYLHDSNDHNKYKAKEELMIKSSKAREMVLATIENIEMLPEEKESYKMLALTTNKRREMAAAFRNHDAEWYMNVLKREGGTASCKEKIKLLILKYRFVEFLYRTVKRIFVIRKGK